ncbi:MAG: hypothetical protein AAGC47_13230 [Bacteroidota bacterium]
MEVKPISSEEFLAHNDQVEGSFFGSSFWMDLHGDSVLPLGVFGKDKLVGTLMLFKYSKLGKEFLIHPPLAPHCGLTVEVTAEKQSTRQGQVKHILSALAAYLKHHHRKSYIDFCLPAEYSDAQPFQWLKFEVSPKHSYRLDLRKSEEELLAEMSTERRKNIKQGASKDYQVQLNGDSKKVLDLLMISVEKASMPNNALVLKKLLRGQPTRYYTTLISDSGDSAAANIVVFDKTDAFYFAGGHNKTKSDSTAGTIALWTSILEAKKLGCEYFDFLGSSVPDIERYFRGYGAELISYLRISQRKGIVAWLKRQKEESK